nr:flagellar hook-length control protein FliK [uncultured Undibacterium sp.]
MSTIFPRLDPKLLITTAVEGPTAVRSIEAIKQDVIQRLSQVGIGKHIQGEVLAKLSDGSFVAKVDGTPMRLSLPSNTQVGEKLSLTLLHLTPRPVFLLNGQNQVTLLDTPKKFRPNDPVSRGIGPENQPFEAEFLSSSKERSPTTITNRQATNAPSDSGKSGQTQASFTNNLSPSQTSNSGQMQASFTNNLSPNQINNPVKLSNVAFLPDNEIAANYKPSSAGETSAKTELSSTGQLINKLILETSRPGEKLSIKGSTPLVNDIADKLTMPQLAKQIETNLHQSVQNSGLFYESHVAEWSVGQRSKLELQSEPQSQIAANVDSSVLTNKEDGNHAALAQLIHQQLDVLEQQKLIWTGMLAPQMPVQLTIEESPQKSAEQEQEKQQERSDWQSYLRIELPNLGVVAMTINLHSNQLQLNIKSSDKNTISLLKTQYSSLQQSIENGGTHIQSFTVQHDEQL